MAHTAHTHAEAVAKRRLAEKGLSLTQAAEIAGMTPNTWRNILRGKTNPRPENLTGMEAALEYMPGEMKALLAGGQPQTSDPQDPMEELRRVGALKTSAGELTWTEHRDGTRDYTLGREIAGAIRGVSTFRSTLLPAEVVEDLKKALSVVERYYEEG